MRNTGLMADKYIVPPRTWTAIGDTQVSLLYSGPDGDQTVTTDTAGAVLIPAETKDEAEVLGGYWMVQPGNVPVRRADSDPPTELPDFELSKDGQWSAAVAVINVEPEPTPADVQPAAASTAAEQFEQAREAAGQVELPLGSVLTAEHLNRVADVLASPQEDRIA